MLCVGNKPPQNRLLPEFGTPATSDTNSTVSNEAFVLTLPGDILDVSNKKKFRTKGGKDGAISAMRNLEKDGLGKLVLKNTKGSVKVNFTFLHGLMAYRLLFNKNNYYILEKKMLKSLQQESLALLQLNVIEDLL